MISSLPPTSNNLSLRSVREASQQAASPKVESTTLQSMGSSSCISSLWDLMTWPLRLLWKLLTCCRKNEAANPLQKQVHDLSGYLKDPIKFQEEQINFLFSNPSEFIRYYKSEEYQRFLKENQEALTTAVKNLFPLGAASSNDLIPEMIAQIDLTVEKLTAQIDRINPPDQNDKNALTKLTLHIQNCAIDLKKMLPCIPIPFWILNVNLLPELKSHAQFLKSPLRPVLIHHVGEENLSEFINDLRLALRKADQLKLNELISLASFELVINILVAMAPKLKNMQERIPYLEFISTKAIEFTNLPNLKKLEIMNEFRRQI